MNYMSQTFYHTHHCIYEKNLLVTAIYMVDKRGAVPPEALTILQRG